MTKSVIPVSPTRNEITKYALEIFKKLDMTKHDLENLEYKIDNVHLYFYDIFGFIQPFTFKRGVEICEIQLDLPHTIESARESMIEIIKEDIGWKEFFNRYCLKKCKELNLFSNIEILDFERLDPSLNKNILAHLLYSPIPIKPLENEVVEKVCDLLSDYPELTKDNYLIIIRFLVRMNFL